MSAASPGLASARACVRCGFYVADGELGGEAAGGNCHRLPPTLSLIPSGKDTITGKTKLSVQAFFAPVDALSWCGEFHAIEERAHASA